MNAMQLNIAHTSQLIRMISLHNQWITWFRDQFSLQNRTTQRPQGKRLLLERSSISNINISNADLTSIQLFKCTIFDSSFYNCELTSSELIGNSFYNCSF